MAQFKYTESTQKKLQIGEKKKNMKNIGQKFL